jgi:putative FmdB family regulatory protein
MPTYEYRCTACGHQLEAFQSMKASPLTDCPACSQPQLKRQISCSMGMIFKGSGFYETDYKRKGGSDEGPRTAEAAPTADKKPATGGCGGGCACHS